jgi:predicted transcriptional regulator
MIAKIESKHISPSYLKTKAIFDTLESLERRNETKAREICRGKIVSVQAHEPISKSVRLMRETGFSQLPVFSGTQVIGSLTEKIILEKLLSAPKPDDVLRRDVETIMDESFPTVGEDTPLSMVSALLQYSPAVLVIKRGHVLGIITKADLLRVVGA